MQTFQKDGRVCKYYRQGRCTRQPCPNKHPESLAVRPQGEQFIPACTRGPKCIFLANNMCHYFHPGVGVQMPKGAGYWQQEHQQSNQPPARRHQEGARGPSQGPRNQQRCHFQLKCWNQEKCSFSHEDFRMNLEFQENY